MQPRLQFLVLTLALAGCASQPFAGSQPPPAVQAGSYDCAPSDSTPGTRLRIISIALDRDGTTLVLRTEAGQHFWLSPVAGTPGLYSAPFYAWRTGTAISVLTDVENIRTYSCRQAGDRVSAAAPGTSGTKAFR